MAQNNQDWDDLGKNIQDIIDRAINSQDFQKLDQTIRQTVERAVDIGGQAVRRAVSNAANAAGTANVSRPVYQTRSVRRLYGGTGGLTVKGVFKAVGGSFLTIISSLAMLGGLVSAELTLGLTAFILTLFAGGAALLGSGISTFTMLNRYAAYRRALGQNTHCSVQRLAYSVGKSQSFVRKDLRKMIANGLFLEGHLDREENNLLTSNETYHYYEQSRIKLLAQQQMAAREQLPTAKPQKTASSHDPQVQEVLDKGNDFIRQIRRCNDAIPGEEISAKISRMEMLVQRIFERVETHPEIVPDLKKLMSYYLPMTVKLLNAYADMDAQPIQGETILSSKREIEASLDTLNLAFEKLLDSVFKDTALDVSSDISVLNTLLAQEGLTESDFPTTK